MTDSNVFVSSEMKGWQNCCRSLITSTFISYSPVLHPSADICYEPGNHPIIMKLAKLKDLSRPLRLVTKRIGCCPRPRGSFLMVMRWPKPETLEGKWTALPLKKTE
jgi:hypothetical protein